MFRGKKILAVEQELNLLFIFTDEQRADTMAAYGNPRIEVPNLNGLSREGIVFERAYVTQAICTPSRASIMTGLYPHTTSCTRNNIPLPQDIRTLPELADFKDYGKCYIGKWHLGDEIFCQHGFDEWISTEDIYRSYYRPSRDRFAHSSYHHWLVKNGFEPPRATEDGFRTFPRETVARMPEEFSKPSFEAQEASRFIWENQERSFILYVNFLEPHMPFFGPRDNQYDPAEVALPENFNTVPTEDQPLKARLTKGSSIWNLKKIYENHLGTSVPTEADWRRLIARYWGLTSQVDTATGKILDTVRKCGLEDNTIIVFTSDHGDMMGSHQLITKGFQFEEAIRVPLIIKTPDSDKSGSVIREPVSQVDLIPTLLDMMGKPVPKDLEGYSWKPMLDGTGDLAEKNIFVEWSPHIDKSDEVDHSVRTIITPDGWKFNLSAFGQHELYNLNEDPLESTNLVRRREYRLLIKKLIRRIKTWQNHTRDALEMPVP